MSIVIGGDAVVVIGETPFFIGNRRFIDGENTVFRAPFDGHVGNGKAVGHVERRYTGSCKFQGFIEGAVDADHADEGQHDVFPGNVFRFFAGQANLNGVGNLKPGLAGSHGDAEVRRADACRKAAQGAVRTGMGVSADSHHARSDDALFRQEDVFDADAAYFKVMGNFVFFGKIADNLGKARRFDVLIGRKVIGH